MKPTQQMMDVFVQAATQLVAGTPAEAVKKLEGIWIEWALSGYEPEADADEDGMVAPDIERDVETRLINGIEDVIGYVADALFELQPAGNNDQALTELEAAMTAYLPRAVDVAADSVKDGVAYSRDPYGYNGVSRGDF